VLWELLSRGVDQRLALIVPVGGPRSRYRYVGNCCRVPPDIEYACGSPGADLAGERGRLRTSPSFDIKLPHHGMNILVRKLVHSRMERLVHNNIRWHAGAWELPSEQFEKPISYDWQDRGASLILISLLSLGLWAAIWVVVALWLLAVSG
jgi:hypothetical protein